MIGHDDIAVNDQFLMLLTEIQAFYEDISVYLTAKYIHPSHNLKGDKIDSRLIVDLVAVRHDVDRCFVI